LTEAAAVWVLLGQRTGDNNQLLRLANELGLPFRTIELRYNRLHLLPPRMLGAGLASLSAASTREIAPPWPKLVLGIGHRSVPAALAIRAMSGGTAKLVRLGNPRLAPTNFDLVITTPQYSVPDAPNVLRLPLGISTAARLEPTREEAEMLGALPRPHRLVLIGGDTFMWTLPPKRVAEAASALKDRGGSVVAVTSGRTPLPVIEALGSALQGPKHVIVPGGFPRYSALVSDADEIFVTADSVAMVSDAIASGKPVGLIEADKTFAGRFFYALNKLGIRLPVRDIRRFWKIAQQRGLAGTLERPTSGTVTEDTLARAVSAIRALADAQAASARRASQPR
jgi:uncharacterized protein